MVRLGRNALVLTCSTWLGAACGAPAGDVDGPEAQDPGFSPGAPVLRRLTQAQFEHAVRDLFGEDVFVPPDLDAAVRVDGLEALGTAVVAISPRGVEQVEQAAFVIADQALAPERRARVVPCTPVVARDEACARQALTPLLRRAWRRPVTEAELTGLIDLSMEAAQTLGDFHEGLAFGIAAILQSPHFLMRPELGRDDPDVPGRRRYTGYELASRLSFFLWDTLPDDALLDAAERGDLDRDDGIDEAVVRMVADPRARDGLRAWAADLLHLAELDDVQKDPAVFDGWSEALMASAREETLLAFEDLVFATDGDMRELLTTRRVHVDRSLARLYGVPAPTREGFGLTELPAEGPRAGLLGQASFLALQAHPASSSATLRGKFVRETLLCQPMPAPPGNVDTSIPEPSVDAPTLRDRVASHLETPSCAGCHRLMDPIGLALEQFDGLAGFRTTDNGATIDARGELDDATFDDALGLAQAIQNHPDFVRCFVDQVTRYALGRDLQAGEAEALEALTASFAGRDHRLQPLWMEIAQSPLFRKVGVAP